MRHGCVATFWGLGLAFCAVLVLPCVSPAQAQSWGEVRVAERVTNVRQTRSPKAPLVRVLQPGDKVKVDFVRPSGWGAVFDLSEPERDEAKAVGFADVRLLVPAAQATKPVAGAKPAAGVPGGGQIRLVEARTEVFKERNQKSPVVAVLAPGEQVQTGFVRDGFAAVFRMTDSGVNEATAVGYVPVGMLKAQGRDIPSAAAKAAVPKAEAPVAAKAAPTPAAAEARPDGRADGRSAPAPELKSEVRESGSLLGSQSLLSKQDPVRITSDKMTYNQDDSTVVFLGNVHGTHGNMALWATKVTAYFVDKNKPKDSAKPQAPGQPGGSDMADKIDRIVAEGNVRLVANKNEGACNQLTYFVQEGLLRMDGNPILREGQSTVRGDVIKFYIRENRSEVISGAQRRVEAIFYTPKGDKK